MPDYNSENVGVTGGDQLIARLSTIPNAAEQGALDGMEQLAEGSFLPYVKEERVPFRLGNLRSSGAVWREEHRVNIEFGTPGSGAEEYAVEQHERLDYHHEFGGPKYLETPLTEWANRFLEAAAQGVRNVLYIQNGVWSRQVVITDTPITEPTMFDQFMRQMRAPKPPARSTAPRLVKKAKI